MKICISIRVFMFIDFVIGKRQIRTWMEKIAALMLS